MLKSILISMLMVVTFSLSLSCRCIFTLHALYRGSVLSALFVNDNGSPVPVPVAEETLWDDDELLL